MILQDNVLKEYLKNVYFISGTPCGGKTTISRALAKRHGLFVYDADERFAEHQKRSDPAFQPSMNAVFPNADAFFGRTVEEYTKWLSGISGLAENRSLFLSPRRRGGSTLAPRAVERVSRANVKCKILDGLKQIQKTAKPRFCRFFL